jgi:outer membrane protein assembly factor BamA
VLAFLFVAALAAGPQAPPGPRETIAAIQIHGNTVTADADIRRLAAVAVGDPFDDATMDAVGRRLRDARRFESVQVLKRFASIADPSQVLLVIIVDEGPVRIETSDDPSAPVRAVRAHRLNLMFLPILSAEDGYGVTYGAQFAVPNPAGANSRIGFPLTWGGDKRAAAEFDKTFAHAPVDRVTAGASASRRRNPFYDADDNRLRVWVRGERHVLNVVRLGATAGSQRVSFPDGGFGPRTTDSFGHGGADVTLDTRVDPVLPRNAVYAKAAWEHIAGANRVDLDARGYVGLFGQTIAQLRVTRSDSDRALAPYLKPLLGGMSTVRGFEAGTAAGDTLLSTSAELLIPLTSPIDVGRIGVSVFFDAGAAYDEGQRLADQTWKRGVGGSIWLTAAFFRINFAVAHGLGFSTRAHVGATVGF